MIRRLLPGLIVVVAWLPLAPPASAAPPAGLFALTDAKVGGDAKLAPMFATTFTAFEITGGPAGSGISLAADKEFPVSVEVGGQKSTGTGRFSMTAAVDPSTGSTRGTFAYSQTYAATWDITETRTTDGVVGDTTILGKGEMKGTWTWKGDVAGSVDVDSAALTFSGPSVSDCTATLLGTEKDCSSKTTYALPVTFTVEAAAPEASVAPITDEAVGVTRDVSGDVYISPASEADLQPADRHWRLIKPGEKIPLEEGATVRTGKDGTVAILFGTGALTRLGPSTMFGLKKFETAQTPTSEMYWRLFDGIADFYMQKWKESGRKFEVETDRANTSIKGTTYRIAVTEAATVVTVAEGVVAVTDKATGTTMDVGSSEHATVDAAGMTKTAAPDASALLAENAPPGASAAAGASPPADGSASPAAVAALSPGADAAASAAPAAPSGSDTGGSSLPIVIGIVAVVVVLVTVGALVLLRRRRA